MCHYHWSDEEKLLSMKLHRNRVSFNKIITVELSNELYTHNFEIAIKHLLRRTTIRYFYRIVTEIRANYCLAARNNKCLYLAGNLNVGNMLYHQIKSVYETVTLGNRKFQPRFQREFSSFMKIN